MSGRGSERGWGSVWSSQPGLFSHLQPLSLFYTQIHTHTHAHTHAHSTHFLHLSHSHTHTHTHTRTHTSTSTSTGWQPHDTATTHHSMPLLYPLNHSLANHMQINIPLSSGHIHHVNNKIHHFAWLPLHPRDNLEKVWQFFLFLFFFWQESCAYLCPALDSGIISLFDQALLANDQNWCVILIWKY